MRHPGWTVLVLAAVAGAEPPAPLPPVPSPSQLAWQRMELTMFLHFGVNTFTDREWGDGKEDPAVFAPSDLDARQWASTAREAGFRLLILTAKHHDGFCLWPSRFTDHSVARSPWKGGKGDVVREFVDACRAEGLKAGLYLSPWDRHAPMYGTDAYNTHFTNQLAELLSSYGAIDEVWFDGACGEGPNGKRQVYDWPAYYSVIRRLQPQAVIAICGPDVRWVGNESGVARPGESSVQPPGAGRHGATAPDAVWYPAECDVSIRPGWFYHAAEDGKVKSIEHLIDIYFKSVGRNSALLLNVPPDRRGRIADPDVRRLREFRATLDAVFATNLVAAANVLASDERSDPTGRFRAGAAADGDVETYWALPDEVRSNAWLEARWEAPRTFNVVDVREFIPLGERVRTYRIEAASGDGPWRTVARGRVIGHRNLHRLGRVTATRVRLAIESAAACPAIAEFGLYLSPFERGWASGSLTAHRPAIASNVHGGGTQWGADKAVDDDMETRWATSDETRACTLEVDLLGVERIGRLALSELEPRITKFELHYRLAPDEAWKTAWAGGKAGRRFEASFDPVSARHVRLSILEATFAPTIWEFQLFPPASAPVGL